MKDLSAPAGSEAINHRGPHLQAEAGAATGDDDLFALFWAACRNKVDRKRTRQAWDAARRKNVTAEDLAKAMAAYTAATIGRDARMVKRPLNWLLGENWNDDLRPAGDNHLDAGIKHGAATNLNLGDKPWNELMTFSPSENEEPA